MYEHGRGVPPDYGAAVYWYSCAAEQGHATAQYLLGLMYDKGHGTTRSNVLAYKWLSLAAAHAHPGVREYYLRIRDAVGDQIDSRSARRSTPAHPLILAAGQSGAAGTSVVQSVFFG